MKPMIDINMTGKRINTLNIETDCVRLLSVQGRVISGWDEFPLPPGYVISTVIENPGGVAEVILELFRKTGISRSRVFVVLNDFRTVTRLVVMPKLKTGSMPEAIMWAAEREMPVPLDSLVISWQVIEKNESEQKVFIAGTPRHALAQLEKTLLLAGISPGIIDSKSLALSRLTAGGSAIIADMENGSNTLILKVNGIPAAVNTTVFSPGGSVIEDRVRKLTDDLFRAVDFYNSGHSDQRLSRELPLYLTGGSIAGDVPEMLRERTGRPVIVPEIPMKVRGEISPARYAANIGLVLREYRKKQDKKSDTDGAPVPDFNIRKGKVFRI